MGHLQYIDGPNLCGKALLSSESGGCRAGLGRKTHSSHAMLADCQTVLGRRDRWK